MSEKNIENLIKEILKDIAINLYDLNYEDSMSILAEYRESKTSDFMYFILSSIKDLQIKEVPSFELLSQITSSQFLKL